MGIDPRAFREAIRTVDVSYPIPFLVSATLATGLAVIGLSLGFADPLRLCLVIAGLGIIIFAIGLIVFSIREPNRELLRSERHQQISRLIEVVSDKDTAPDARGAAREALRFLSETKGLRPDIEVGDKSDG